MENNPQNILLSKKNVEDFFNKVIKKDKIKDSELDRLFGNRLTKEERNKFLDTIFNNDDNKLKINDINIYRQSFVQKSFMKKIDANNINPNILPYVESKDGSGDIYRPVGTNERLEYLGDTFIKCTVSYYLYNRYPKEKEGFLTDKKSSIESKTGLPKFANYLDFKKFLILPEEQEQKKGENKGRDTLRYLEDAFEAFVGAIMEDFGIINGTLVTYLFIKGLIENAIDMADVVLSDINYKHKLLQYYQARQFGQPSYPYLYYKGNTSNRIFTVCTILKKKDVKALPKAIRDNIKESNRIYKNLINIAYQEEVDNEIYTKKDEKNGRYYHPKEGVDEYKRMINNDYVIVGMGSEKKIKGAEQAASMDALKNLDGLYD